MVDRTDAITRTICALLLEKGQVTEEEYRHALAESSEGGVDIIESLLKLGYTTEEIVADDLSESYGLERIDLAPDAQILREAVNQLPQKFVQESKILPFNVDGNTLQVAISDPTALGSINTVRVITGKQVSTFFTTFSQLHSWLSFLKQEEWQAKESGPKKEVADEEEAYRGENIDYVNLLIKNAINKRVSDIHIEPYKATARVRLRLDGVMSTLDDKENFIFNHYPAVVARLKILAGLDIAERRLPQDGAISFRIQGRDVDIRLSILPTTYGERVVMRILDHTAFQMDLDALGIPDEDLVILKRAVDAPQGIVLVTGPTGSGKSSTLYSALNRVNREDINILTAEDPVEYTLEGAGQVQIKEDIGLTFSGALRSFLRQDPEVILVGEMRDQETAEIAIKSALTGHLVLSTLHTNDAPSTIIRLVNMGIEPYLITASLSLVVAQRLVRRICETCVGPDQSITQELLTSIGFSSEESEQVEVVRGRGCKACHQTGYRGRRAVFEVMEITDEIRRIILSGHSSSTEIADSARQNGYVSLQERGLDLIRKGSLTVEEYERVLVLR